MLSRDSRKCLLVGQGSLRQNGTERVCQPGHWKLSPTVGPFIYKASPRAAVMRTLPASCCLQCREDLNLKITIMEGKSFMLEKHVTEALGGMGVRLS